MKLPMTLKIGHYDDPPPDRVDDLIALRDADRFRFANQLSAWIEVEDGRIVDAGYDGGGIIGATTANLGVTSLTFPAVAFPDLQRDPEVGDGSVRFVQTAGGATGAGMPRRVNQAPYVRIAAPIAWTTLALTLHTDGRVGVRARRARAASRATGSTTPTGSSSQQVRVRRLRELGVRGGPDQHPVGRPRRAGAGHHRRDGARTRPVAAHHAGRGGSRHPPGPQGRSSPSRAHRVTSCSSCSTGSSPSRSTVRGRRGGSGRGARRAGSARGRAVGPRRCGRRPPPSWRWPTPTTSTSRRSGARGRPPA
jgi:hypothetical protein